MAYDDKATDQALYSLQANIAKTYQDAYTDIARTANSYWANLKPRYDAEHAAYVAGKYGYANLQPAQAKAKFDAWYASQIGRGERWDKLRDDMAKRLNEAQKVATAYINDATPGIYALNANYSAYLIEANTGADFTIYDERTVADLIQGKTQILPEYEVNGAAAMQRDRKRLSKALTSGILQGQPIDKIAQEFERVTQMDANAAIRAARTAMTAAQNAGRQDTYERAQEMGIEMEKEWIATEDSRTRESHAELDGVRVPINDDYPNGLQFPGDPRGEGEEIYNCRCTQRAIIKKYNGEPRETHIDGHEGIHTKATYDKWLEKKKAEEEAKREAKMNDAPYTHADATARAMEAAEDRLDEEIVEAAGIQTNYKEMNISAIRKTPNGFEAFPDDENNILHKKYMQEIPKYKNYYDIGMHGDIDGVGIGTESVNTSARDLARLIKSQEDYKPHQPVRLFACKTGIISDDEYCFAEELANALGVEVLAPSDLIYLMPHGKYRIGFDDRKFTPFRPNQRGRYK